MWLLVLLMLLLFSVAVCITGADDLYVVLGITAAAVLCGCMYE